MSRIGKRPVPLPSGVSATTEGQILSVKGPKGTLDLQMREEIAYDIGDDGIHVKPANDTKQARAFWGMQRTLVDNLVVGGGRRGKGGESPTSPLLVFTPASTDPTSARPFSNVVAKSICTARARERSFVRASRSRPMPRSWP